MLAGTGLERHRLADGDPRVDVHAETRALRNAFAGGLPASAALEQRPSHPADYGVLGYAMMSCATLGRAIRIAMRYYRTVGPLAALHFRVERDQAVLEMEDERGLHDLLPWLSETLFLSLPSLLTGLLGRDVRALEVRLAHPRPTHGARLEAALGAPVRYAEPLGQFRFAAHLLDAPLVRADADSALLFEESCRALLDALEGETSLAGRISRDLLAHPGEMPGAAQMATRLNMSERTLRRRLEALGTSYQALLDGVRQRLAEDYLRSTDLPVQEIAELLGYTEATNFRRAFLKWTGESPLACRRSGLQVRGVPG